MRAIKSRARSMVKNNYFREGSTAVIAVSQLDSKEDMVQYIVEAGDEIHSILLASAGPRKNSTPTLEDESSEIWNWNSTKKKLWPIFTC